MSFGSLTSRKYRVWFIKCWTSFSPFEWRKGIWWSLNKGCVPPNKAFWQSYMGSDLSNWGMQFLGIWSIKWGMQFLHNLLIFESKKIYMSTSTRHFYFLLRLIKNLILDVENFGLSCLFKFKGCYQLYIISPWNCIWGIR